MAKSIISFRVYQSERQAFQIRFRPASFEFSMLLGYLGFLSGQWKCHYAEIGSAEEEEDSHK